MSEDRSTSSPQDRSPGPDTDTSQSASTDAQASALSRRRLFRAAAVGTLTGVGGSLVADRRRAAPTENWQQGQKLVAENGDSGDQFGLSMAIDGSTALVGTPSDGDPNGNRAGSAYVFEQRDGEWSQRTRLAADDGDDGDNFGVSVALAGSMALVGASEDGGSRDDKPGSAYVFERDGESWSQQAKLTADDGDAEDRFGWSVAIDGSTALVGAPGEEYPNGNRAGSAYVFEQRGGEWSQQAKLVASDGGPDDRFGTAVALDGSRALVGPRSDEGPPTEAGISAYVFEQSDGSWTQQAKLVVDDDESNKFGFSVALEGSTALVGAPDDGAAAGSAYVFVDSDCSWTRQAKLTADDGDAEDRFGWSVALDGSVALVGAFEDEDPNGPEAGSAYAFERSGQSWEQRAKLTADGGDGGDRFGWSVALDDSTALVGAPQGENTNGLDAGSVHVFENETSQRQDEQDISITTAPERVTLTQESSTELTVSVTNTGTGQQRADSASIELVGVPEGLTVRAVESAGAVLDRDDDGFTPGDVVAFGVSSSPPAPGESVTATLTLETTTDTTGDVGDITLSGNLNASDPPTPEQVSTPITAWKEGELASRFDDGDGTIQAGEVLEVIRAQNQDDSDLTAQQVLAVIAEYNGDSQWSNVTP